MDLKQAMAELESLGSAQTRKVMANHGAGDNQFGVKFGDMYKLQKKIKIDHQLAKQLWDTGNSDARILALLIADPDAMCLSCFETWCQDITFFMHSNYLGDLLAASKITKEFFNKWMDSNDEFFLNTAYSALCKTLKTTPDKFTESEYKKILKYIAKTIHDKPNRGRSAMNNALIAIGTYVDPLSKEAIKIGKDLGPIQIDHGTTNCKTPYAPDYIKKCLAHKNKKKS